MWGDVANALQGVKDPATLQTALQAFSLEHPEEANTEATRKVLMQLTAGGYDQSLVDRIRDAAVSQKDQAAARASNARAGADAARAKVDETEIPLNKMRTLVEKQRLIHLNKAGSTVDLPKSVETNTALDQIKQYVDIDSVTVGSSEFGKARSVAMQIAVDAKALQDKTPKLSRLEATKIVAKAAWARGDLAGLKPLDKSIGGTAGKPAALPPNFHDKAPPENRWYVVPGQREPMYFTNGVFKSASELSKQEETEDDSDPDQNEDDSED
jgi:hypothetical protein